jgi:ribonuclease G
MSKELFVTSTPHETKVAIVEDDQVVEVYFERENEYTLAGSIYKGKVTRVLPGMQSAFVDLGLERDAFLYVTDFLEEVEDQEEFEKVVTRAHSDANRQTRPERSEEAGEPLLEADFTETEEAQASPEVQASTASESGEAPERGPRRWRGRRGRRRGRRFDGHPAGEETKPEQKSESAASEAAAPLEAEEIYGLEAGPEQEEEQQTAPVEEIAADESRPEPKREPRPERPSRRPEPVILPGESLAKFNRQVKDKDKEEAAEQEGVSRQEPQPAAPRMRPSTEVSAVTGFTAAGVLQGESLAKYRNRPAPTPPEPPAPPRDPEELSTGTAVGDVIPENQEQEVIARPRDPDALGVAPAATEASFDDSAAEPSKDIQGYANGEDREPESLSSAATAESAMQEEQRFEQAESSSDGDTSAELGSERQVEVPADDHKHRFNFHPGSGVIEEEEIEEEEHEAAHYSDQIDDLDYEEMEEETLDPEVREAEVIAAGEGLMEAVARSQAEEQQESYLEELEEGEAAEFEEDEQADQGEEEDESGREMLSVDESEEASDAETEAYGGRAEHRTTAGTAAFQNRAAGRERVRDHRGRNRRGRRPAMRRRNIPRQPIPLISDLLKEGQEILVQIAKEPMAKKGARITSHIALPGRFLVYMPTVGHTGVSRKIASEEERQRLKRILLSEKGQAHGGFIVRTAAAGASEDDLRADIRFLINLWNEIRQRADSGSAPALIYHDLNLVERILRDQVTSTFSHIWVDTEQEYERILRFAQRFQPSLLKRVKLYTKEAPLFEQFGVQEEINKALKSKVWLKSGGYIVINQTEALVAIDINTGKYVGKTSRLEDTIVKTNIDAIKEIVRQIRLRDLGGIIIIDFIDMDERKNRQKVMQALEEALRNDRSPSKVLQFNDFGLVAITRKRVKQSLERTLCTTCTYCTGTGFIKSVPTVCNEIYVEMRRMLKHFDSGDVMLRVNPEVAKALKANSGRWLQEMEELIGKTVIVKSDPSLHQEQFDIQ